MDKIEKINFKVQRNCAKTGIISSSVLFHQYFQVFRTKSKFFFRHLEMNFLRSYFIQSHRRLRYDPNYLGTKLLSTCYSNFWWIP